MAMMNVALDVLVNKVSYELPPQDLSYSMSKIPTLPESGVIMKHVKIKQWIFIKSVLVLIVGLKVIMLAYKIISINL